jgi:hypothetical protein
MTNASASQKQRSSSPKGPTGRVVAQYGNEAGAAFDVTPENTAGLRAGAVVRDAAGRQWMVDDNYRWTPYTGAAQWQAVSSKDDIRQKLVQDWYDSGKDPDSPQAAALEAWLEEQGRLGAVTPRVGGPITRERAGQPGAGSGEAGGNVPPLAEEPRSASGGSPSEASGAGPLPGGAHTTPYQSFLNDYERRRDGIVNGLAENRFSYDPAADPLWQSYQKQYRREG